MIHHQIYKNAHIELEPLQANHALFIKSLLNTRGWIHNIGYRHIHTIADASNYIQKIHQAPLTYYWVIKHLPSQQCVGLNTILIRNYLPHADIGFALLPQFMGKGIAFEASQLLLQHQINQSGTLNGITIPSNTASINLLTKLGMHYKRSIHINIIGNSKSTTTASPT